MPSLCTSPPSPPSALFSRGRAGQENMDIWLTQTNKCQQWLVSTPLTPPRTICGGEPSASGSTRLVYKGSRSLLLSITLWRINLRLCFWNTHSFSRRTLYCSSPLPPSTSWSSFVINSFSNWKQSQNFHRRMPGILRRGHVRHPTNLSRFDPTALLTCERFPPYSRGRSSTSINHVPGLYRNALN